VRECIKERLTLGGEALLFWRFIDEAFGGAGQLTEDRIPIKGRLWRFRSYLACHTIRITARPSHAQPEQYLGINVARLESIDYICPLVEPQAYCSVLS
jgi:hypothetical protein